ncbi:MAG: DUF4038 domain-containing protein [Acidimicrobiia bacterium]|nr:DUF4038 domain-containing protein [Acidimicrobiia bacterium]
MGHVVGRRRAVQIAFLLVAAATPVGVTDAAASTQAPDLEREFWVVTADSEENQQIYSARSAIDGDPATFWHTEFSPTPHPHWITIDLLHNAEVEGFRYQGRPDGTGVPNGRVGQFAFYVSEQPDDWSTLTPVTTGSFPDDAAEHEITFPPVYGRYLTFVALSEAGNRGGWTTVAELNVMGRFRDIAVQAVQGSVASWTPVVDGLTTFSCSISQTGGPQWVRAWVDPTCDRGLFDTHDLAPGDYSFQYELFDGTTTRRGQVTVSAREPMRVYDTAWSIPLKASDEELEQYFTFLDNAGHAGVWISLVPNVWQGGLEEPNRHGHAFESFDSPNPLYLEHVDHILDTAQAHGLTVNIVVAWASDWVGDRPAAKWHGILDPAPIHELNGAAYGATLANRWKGHPALEAWVMGGDWWTPETEAETEPTWEAIVAGIRSTGATEPITYHTGGFHSSWVMFADREWVDFLSPETSHCNLPDVAQGALTALREQFGKDVVSAEMRYEDEPMQERGVSTWCYPEGPAVGFIGADEIAADAQASWDAGAVAYVYGQDTRWNWGGPAGLATLGRPGEYAALDIAADGVLGGDTTPPSWPGGASLTGSATDTTASLSWGAATDNNDVVLYRIHHNGDVVERAPGLTETVRDLTPGTTYDFHVEAVDAVGNSAPGPAVSLTTAGEPPPIPPGDRIAMFDPATGQWHLRHGAGDVTSFYYGMPGDVPLLGDWDGNGTDTPGMYRPSTGYVYLTNAVIPDGGVAVAEVAFFFGIDGDQVLVGDWDGDGHDTLGIRRGDRVYLTNVNETSNASSSFVFGVAGDIAFGGDPNRDGRDTVFLYRPVSGFVYFTNDSPAGHSGVATTEGSLHFGVPTDRFVVGDWDGDGDDTGAVFRPDNTTTYISNTNTTAWAADSWVFGESDWLPVAGHY